MKWYADRLRILDDIEPVISVCGDDCAVCPRFLARTEEELHETALFDGELRPVLTENAPPERFPGARTTENSPLDCFSGA